MEPNDFKRALIKPEEGWAPGLITGPRSYSFLSDDEQRICVRYFRRESDDRLVGRVWFGPHAQGPPGCAHGGSMAAILDEAMGTAAWLAQRPAVMADLKVSYRKLLPLECFAHFEAWIVRIEGRKIHARARLFECEGTQCTYSESKGLLIAPKNTRKELAVRP